MPGPPSVVAVWSITCWAMGLPPAPASVAVRPANVPFGTCQEQIGRSASAKAAAARRRGRALHGRRAGRPEPAPHRRGGRDEPPHAALPLRLQGRPAARGRARGGGRTQAALAAIGADAGGETDELIRRMWAYVADPALGRLRAAVLRPLRPGPPGRRVHPAAAETTTSRRWLDTNVAVAAALGVPADVARAHARLGLAVTRGLLLDLLATGDRAGVEAALEVFARRYAGRWWESRSSRGRSRQRPRLVAAAVARRHGERHRRTHVDAPAPVGDGGGVEP